MLILLPVSSLLLPPSLLVPSSVKGRVAYVPQHAWIMSGTIEVCVCVCSKPRVKKGYVGVPLMPFLTRVLQENILLGRDMDIAWYNKVIDCCCLRPDLDSFDLGDQTEVPHQTTTIPPPR